GWRRRGGLRRGGLLLAISVPARTTSLRVAAFRIRETTMNVVDVITRLFETGGNAAYFGEPVSQTEHALQTAHLAESEGAPDSLVVAALLHDVGHLLDGLPESIADTGIDGRHEAGGSEWLSRHFGPAVVDPVRLHVAAKRYLCAVDPGYLAL